MCGACAGGSGVRGGDTGRKQVGGTAAQAHMRSKRVPAPEALPSHLQVTPPLPPHAGGVCHSRRRCSDWPTGLRCLHPPSSRSRGCAPAALSCTCHTQSFPHCLVPCSLLALLGYRLSPPTHPSTHPTSRSRGCAPAAAVRSWICRSSRSTSFVMRFWSSSPAPHSGSVETFTRNVQSKNLVETFSRNVWSKCVASVGLRGAGESIEHNI